jgi:hypothetical protein
VIDYKWQKYFYSITFLFTVLFVKERKKTFLRGWEPFRVNPFRMNPAYVGLRNCHFMPNCVEQTLNPAYFQAFSETKQKFIDFVKFLTNF